VKGDAVAQIEVEETERGMRRAVAGSDFTFSVPKSASALWAVAGAGTQTLIGEAHPAAVAEVVSFMEREVAATRTGATAGDGAVAQVDVTGLVATARRAGDSRLCLDNGDSFQSPRVRRVPKILRCLCDEYPLDLCPGSRGLTQGAEPPV